MFTVSRWASQQLGLDADFFFIRRSIKQQARIEDSCLPLLVPLVGLKTTEKYSSSLIGFYRRIELSEAPPS